MKIAKAFKPTIESTRDGGRKAAVHRRSPTILDILSLIGAVVSAPSQAVPSQLNCPALTGARDLLANDARERRFVVIGELHGTSESPALFGDLVCNLATERPVSVALEFNVSATPALQAYVASAGTAVDKSKLLSSAAWSPSRADGRSSVAMLDLLDSIRKMRAAGGDIQVFATQPMGLPGLDQNYFELAMADEWAKVASARPQAIVVALVGRAHAQLSMRDDGLFLPAAAHLKPADVLSLKPEDEGGEAWNCQRDGCGGHPIAGKAVKPRYVAALSGVADGFNGIYAIGGRYSASPPAAAAHRP